jgi:hypothetical protein
MGLIKVIRRVMFGGLAVFLFYQAVSSIRQAGITLDAALPAAAAVLFSVMAVLGKGG